MRAELASARSGSAFDVGAWRTSRLEAAQRARELLCEAARDPGRAALLVLLDDNMHFRSMRKGAFHLARECGAAFVHVHVAAPLPLALARNAARAPVEQVPVHLLVEMVSTYEAAPSETQGWERPTITVHATADDEADAGWTALLDPAELVHAWRERQPAEVDPASECDVRDTSRQATLASVLHQLDIRSRQMVALSMEAASHLPAGEKRALAARLNEARKRLLARTHAPSADRLGDSAQGALGPEDAARLVADEEYAAFGYECRSFTSGAPEL
ncbi:hypothetical protein T492DRAFT_1066902 [Pavlovales sp. CCMP2436]|nr:hypothetical protein T492DRAFT_1066902 [Pavlovales sp. CCMP2436]